MVLKPTRPKPAQADWCCSTVTPQHQRSDYRGRTQDWGHRGAELQNSSPQSHSVFAQGHETCKLTASDHPLWLHGREKSRCISVTWSQSWRCNSSTWTNLADFCAAMNDTSIFCGGMRELNSPLPGVMSYFLAWAVVEDEWHGWR